MIPYGHLFLPPSEDCAGSQQPPKNTLDMKISVILLVGEVPVNVLLNVRGNHHQGSVVIFL